MALALLVMGQGEEELVTSLDGMQCIWVHFGSRTLSGGYLFTIIGDRLLHSMPLAQLAAHCVVGLETTFG